MDVELNAYIASVANGSTIQFPTGSCYLTANRVEVRDKADLTIDGGGSTFRTTADGCTSQAVKGNWVLLRGSNITLRNMTAVGAFNVPGPRSLPRASAHPCFSETAMNFGVYGTTGAWLVDVKGHNAWGDAVTLGPAHYADPTHDPLVRGFVYASNVHVVRMEARKTARHCWSPTSGVGVWIEDSTCTDAWYVGLDAETDNQDQPLRDHHYLRNTFDGFNLGGLIVPVPGQVGRAPVGDIEIRGNRFLTPPDQVCNPTLLVGAYPNIGPGWEFTNITIRDNEQRAFTRAIVLDRVRGGSVGGNVITQLSPNECGEARQVIVTNSTGVVVDGPVAPVTSAPTTTSAPVTTQPPATTSTTAAGSSGGPANLAITSRTPSTVGLTWGAVPGATEYRAYVSRSSGSGFVLWASGLTGTSGTLFSLTGDYYVQVRAVVGGAETPGSNVVLATA